MSTTLLVFWVALVAPMQLIFLLKRFVSRCAKRILASSQKVRYARTILATSNHRRKILHTTSGHPGGWNDKTLDRFDLFTLNLCDGAINNKMEFELKTWPGMPCDDEQVVGEDRRTLTLKGAYVIVDNGYLEWSTTVPHFKSSCNRSELSFSQWLDSMRKGRWVHLWNYKGALMDFENRKKIAQHGSQWRPEQGLEKWCSFPLGIRKWRVLGWRDSFRDSEIDRSAWHIWFPSAPLWCVAIRISTPASSRSEWSWGGGWWGQQQESRSERKSQYNSRALYPSPIGTNPIRYCSEWTEFVSVLFAANWKLQCTFSWEYSKVAKETCSGLAKERPYKLEPLLNCILVLVNRHLSIVILTSY